MVKESVRLSPRRCTKEGAKEATRSGSCSQDAGGDALGRGRKGSAASGVRALSGECAGSGDQDRGGGQGPVAAGASPVAGVGG